MTQHQVVFQILNAVQDEDIDEIIEKAGYSGIITIATLIAGRGTDIQIDKEKSLPAGGLDVILTFYPDSKRNEDQAIGRAGRQGQPGSSQLILSTEKISPCTSIAELSEMRRRKENQMKEVHVNRAEMEHYCETFRSAFFDQLNLFHQLIENESILAKLASAISEFRLINPEEKRQKIDLSSLHVKDSPIVIEAFQLLTSKSESNKVNLTPWISFLKQLGQRVENKIIVAWSLKFHQPMEVILSANLPPLEQQVNISKLFEDHKNEWEKYLDPTGKGMAVLLQELTEINLLSCFKPPKTRQKKKKSQKEKEKIAN